MKPQKRKLKLPGWYSGVNPMKSRPGWYQCFCCNRLLFWNGLNWVDSNKSMYTMAPPAWRGVSR